MAPKLARPAAANHVAKARARPKAKMKARAKAKAVAALRVRVRRRLEAHVPGVPALDWKKIEEVKLEDFATGIRVLVSGYYWESEIDLCGVVKGGRIEGLDKYLRLQVLGTRSEALLKYITGTPDRVADLYLCPAPYPSLVWRDGVIHGTKIKEAGTINEDWMDNLGILPRGGEEQDQNEALRREAGEEEARRKILEGDRKDKKEKEPKEKEKKEKKRAKDIRAADGRKKLKVLYEGTALNPDLETRKAAMKKAKRMKKKGKKKKKKKKSSGESSGSYSSSSSTTEATGAEIFDGEREVQRLWRRSPGALGLLTILEAQQHLVLDRTQRQEPCHPSWSNIISGPA